VFYGLKRAVSPEETALFEKRINPEYKEARRLGLDYYWGVFEEEDNCQMFIGKKIAMLGPEGVLVSSIDLSSFEAIARRVDKVLADAGMDGTPKLWLDWMPNE
jgi:hypothetical protein